MCGSRWICCRLEHALPEDYSVGPLTRTDATIAVQMAARSEILHTQAVEQAFNSRCVERTAFQDLRYGGFARIEKSWQALLRRSCIRRPGCFFVKYCWSHDGTTQHVLEDCGDSIENPDEALTPRRINEQAGMPFSCRLFCSEDGEQRLYTLHYKGRYGAGRGELFRARGSLFQLAGTHNFGGLGMPMSLTACERRPISTRSAFCFRAPHCAIEFNETVAAFHEAANWQLNKFYLLRQPERLLD